MTSNRELITIDDACKVASKIAEKEILPSNISYLIQYARINKFNSYGAIRVDKKEIIEYFERQNKKEIAWKKKLGDDLNWNLSFSWLRERETTKHVHRLHPYKGKFIPQLVEYFLDSHTNNFKKEVFFNPGDIILDPFCGSGTTLVQCNELGLHAVGIDISEFNSLITNVKLKQFEIKELIKEVNRITQAITNNVKATNYLLFEEELNKELSSFNNKYFPSPDYRLKVRNKEINQFKYGQEKANEFNLFFSNLLQKYNIQLLQSKSDNFLDIWYLNSVRGEIDFLLDQITRCTNQDIQEILKVILSRAVRSSRATTHYDLATLKSPITTPYYCRKHYKICKPLFSMISKWTRYANDTISRYIHFYKIRTNTYQLCLTGDSRTISIIDELKKINPSITELIEKNKIKGIFSSPPYVGLIDYHEQHAYAYDLFGFTRRDDNEIGPLYKGNSNAAKESYIEGVSAVLNNCKKFLVDDYEVFLVANDKFNLYPQIANLSGMRIIEKYKRPVLNRTEGDKNAYSEIIFRMKKK